MPDIMPKSDKQIAAEGSVEEVRKNLGPFVVAAEVTRMPMIFTDACEAGNPIIFANDAYLELTRLNREEILGQRFDFMMPDGAPDQIQRQLDRAFVDAYDNCNDVDFQRPDGSRFCATVMICPVRDDHDAIIQHFASLIDLSVHKQEAAQAQMLIDELNHRVKNMLSTVQSIIIQALRYETDTAVVRESIESRLLALSRSHDLLTLERWEGIDLGDLVHQSLEPFGVGNGRAERFIIAGGAVRMPPKATLALGIALHELATNAVKYGAFSNASGCVRIAWQVAAGPRGNRLVITWEERDGPAVATPTRTGFGSRVLTRGLAHELAATVQLEFPPSGVVCTVDIPAPEGAAIG